MSAATLTEEPQQNLTASKEGGKFEDDDKLDANALQETVHSFPVNNQFLNGVTGDLAEDDEGEEEDEDEDEDEDDGDEVDDGESGEDDEEDDEDSLSSEDAEGEEEEGIDHNNIASVVQDEDEEDEDEDEEGVGAVKINPDLLDDDDDEASAQGHHDESDESVEEGSKESSDAESEAEAEWDAAADEDEDGDAETVNRSRCIFCQQDEEHDPSADFEEYLACAVCGDNCMLTLKTGLVRLDEADEAAAHRQCARDADALKSEDDAEQWRCPTCISNALEPETAMANSAASLSVRRSSAPKLARDLLPPQRGSIKPDSHSVFNHLIVDDDPMDGSRLLRKRKTSSAEAEDHPASLRKRRKNDADSSSRLVTSDSGATEEIANKVKENNNEGSTVGGDKDEPISPRASRSLRPKSAGQSHASISKKTSSSLVICLRLNPSELNLIVSQISKPLAAAKKRRSRTAAGARISSAPSTYITQSYSLPFYSFQDKENDELKSKPYGGILVEAEADTSKTLPQPEDRRRFDEAQQKYEEEWKAKSTTTQAELETVKKIKKVSGPASQIECINFGGYEIDTWYAAPYPEEYSRNRVLHICEFCLKYMNSEYVAWRHKLKCPAKHPPGDEIYRDGSIAVFEVDGRKNPVYCQNLCLLAKLFLGSKTLYYDVEPFLFYVMTEYDELGCHFVGYFSKEKRPASQNNVSCILTLPIHQRKGYGNLLIDFSYLLTRVEKKSGSPEKPLSDMGLVSYRNYWRLILCYQLRNQKIPVSICEISERTGMTADDIVSALEGLRALVRDPVTSTYALRLDFDFYQDYIQRWENKNYVKLNPKALIWTPYIMGRNNASIIEHSPRLNAVAPREGEEDESRLEAASHRSLVNGNSGLSINGMALGDEQEQDLQPEPMDIDVEPSPTVPSTAVLGNGKGNGMGKEKRLTIETNIDEPATSPSSSRQIRQTSSAPARLNGFNPSTSIWSFQSMSTIPPSRFEIFPPVPGSRSANRSRPGTVSNRSAQRHRSALSSSMRRSRVNGRGRERRSSNSSRQRSSEERRRPGGTGRGPGRWPKGTKKSDFGNAESGPGLPPKSLKQRSRLVMEVTLGDEDEGLGKLNGSESVEADDCDSILYETPGPRRRRNGDGEGIAGKYKGRENGNGVFKEEDFELVTGDVDEDAEGEDE